MNAVRQKIWMWLFGIASIVGLSLFLFFTESSPGPLSAPHAEAIPGKSSLSCRHCHSEEGLSVGCRSCHVEIQEQVEGGQGYHAYLFQGLEPTCNECHSEHHGESFPLVSSLSWTVEHSNSFSHPHVEFVLEGSHTDLTCENCHDKAGGYALPGFEEYHRSFTFLGLTQECISCHQNIHKTEKTATCTDCHNQQRFVPASGFDHTEFFLLEGAHAKASCSDCHSGEAAAGSFGAVAGTSCIDCHQTPHRSTEISRDCRSCHDAADASWREGVRGIDEEVHARFGFLLEKPHQELACSACHTEGLEYGHRFVEPARKQNQCHVCHDDPHAGQFSATHPSCLTCHQVERFYPSKIGLSTHTDRFPLTGSHRAVACVQCHEDDPASSVRKFSGVSTACKSCHANPHGDQFHDQLQTDDCTACHSADASSFMIRPYSHHNELWFFQGQKHRQADCQQCHQEDPGIYAETKTACSSCHTDPHRGQFKLAGINDCRRCHGSTESWSAFGFNHETDSRFPLAGSHSKVSCAACHRPALQPDGRAVIQYRPLTTRCEDCHGFESK